MLKALLKVRIASLLASMFKSSNKTGSSKKAALGKIGIALLILYGFGTISFLFGFFYSSLVEPFHAAGIDWLYFLLAGLATTGIMFVSSIFTAQTQLFESKDNDLLLALPIRPSYLLLSRMSVLLIICYFFDIVLFLPALVVYLMNYTLSYAQIICYFGVFLVLPLFAIAFASLFGWILAMLTSRMRNKTVFTIILSLIFLGGYFYVNSQLESYITLVQTHGEAIANSIKSTAFPLFWIGSAISDGNFLYLLYVVLFCTIPFALVYFIISKNFVRIATTKSGGAKVQYVERKFKIRSAKNALLRKELSRYGSSAMYILNTSLGVLFGIVGAVLLALNSDEVLLMSRKLTLDEMYLGIIAAVALCALSAVNLISAPSISLEGKSLWIPQSLPVHAREVLFAKAKLQLVICVPGLLITQTIIAVALKFSATNVFVLFLLPLVFAIFSALFGVYINLMFPKFDWVSETVAIKQGVSILLAMLGLTIAVAIPAFVYVKFLQSHMDVLTYTLLFTSILGIASLALYRYLETNGAKRFETLH